MANALRSAMHELDAELPLANVLTMQEILSESVGSRRFQTLLASVFAGMGNFDLVHVSALGWHTSSCRVLAASTNPVLPV